MLWLKGVRKKKLKDCIKKKSHKLRAKTQLNLSTVTAALSYHRSTVTGLLENLLDKIQNNHATVSLRVKEDNELISLIDASPKPAELSMRLQFDNNLLWCGIVC